eukprot:9267422-Alexandrium_andersonii.AAC.1
MSASLVGSEMCIRDSRRRRAKRGASNQSNRAAPTLIENVKIASCVRTWDCAGPGMASKWVPEALEAWILR